MKKQLRCIVAAYLLAITLWMSVSFGIAMIRMSHNHTVTYQTEEVYVGQWIINHNSSYERLHHELGISYPIQDYDWSETANALGMTIHSLTVHDYLTYITQ